jgi:hypothetical protein
VAAQSIFKVNYSPNKIPIMQSTIYQARGISRISRQLTFLLMGLGLAALMSCGGGGDAKPADSTAASGVDSAGLAFDLKPTDVPLVLSDSLKVPAGFNVNTVVEGFGGARHIAIAPNGAIFVKLAGLQKGKGIYRLMDGEGIRIWRLYRNGDRYP